MTIGESFDNFILSRQLADLSPKTIDNYRQFVTPFIVYLGSYRQFTDITQDLINSYLQTLLKKPLSKSTRSTYIRHIKIYLRWCENTYNSCYSAKSIKVPKSPKRNVRIYSDDEVLCILDSVRAETPWLTYRNKCIVALMYDSGLRQAEVCGLKLANIYFSENIMTVRGKGDKERTVPLGKLTKHFMKQYLSACPYESDFLFVNRRGDCLTCNALKLLITKAADKLPFDLSCHKLRHNFATNYCLDQYYKNGQIDIYRLMYLMGHADLSTTQRYLHFAYEIIASKGCISHLDNILNEEI